MKKISLRFIGFIMMLMLGQQSFAASGPLFNVVSSGTEDRAEFILCLNARGDTPVSCQRYRTNALDLIITPNTSHTYPYAGIKPLSNHTASNCTVIGNGYCIFSVSRTAPRQLVLTPATPPAGSLTISPSTLPSATQYTFYSETVTASGGTRPYTYRVASGALPTGLSINESTGNIFGMPSASGTFNFTVLATDADSNRGSQEYSIDVTAAVASSYAYIANVISSAVTLCNIDNDNGALDCQVLDDTFNAPLGVATNPEGTYAYIASTGENSIKACTIDSDSKTFDTCSTASSHVSNPTGIAVHPEGTTAYVTSSGGDDSNKVFHCPISNGTFSTCTSTGTGFSRPWGVAVNTAGTRAYVTNRNGNNVSVCTIDQTTKAFTTCVTQEGFNGPAGITIDATDSYAYVTNLLNQDIVKCPIAQDTGLFGTCTQNVSGLFTYGIALGRVSGFAYTPGFSLNAVQKCPVGNDGTLGSCTEAAGAPNFSGPVAIAVVN